MILQFPLKIDFNSIVSRYIVGVKFSLFLQLSVFDNPRLGNISIIQLTGFTDNAFFWRVLWERIYQNFLKYSAIQKAQ